MPNEKKKQFKTKLNQLFEINSNFNFTLTLISVVTCARDITIGCLNGWLASPFDVNQVIYMQKNVVCAA